MTRARDVADTQDNTGGAVAPFLAGKNKIINGDFGVWQRGTSFSGALNGFTSDRWSCAISSGDAISQQTFTPGTAPVQGYESTFFTRISFGSSTNIRYFWQKIEDVRTFANQTVTMSFWAKANTATVGYPYFGNQNFGTGGSAFTGGPNGTVNLTTSWQRFSITGTVPSIAGKTIGTNSYIEVGFSNTTPSITLDIWGVQLEAGNVATPFTTATGTLAGELAACQRYYFRSGGLNTYQIFGSGYADQTTTAQIMCPLPVTMRVVPTSLDFSTLNLTTGGTNFPVTGLTFNTSVPGNTLIAVYPTVASGLTVNRPYFLTANGSTSAYLGFSAEL